MSEDRLQVKCNTFYAVAERLASLSCCTVRQHGAIIVPFDLSEIVAIGYNGPPRGTDNSACSGEDGSKCGCVHAETNALVKLRSPRKDLLMICTKSPCLECAKLIVNSGAIRLVAYRNAWSRILEADKVLRFAKVSSVQIGSLASWLDDYSKGHNI